jgi:excisionase family DNA binding protein
MKLAYSINEAAKVLSIGRTTLYHLINAGELKVVKLGSRTLVRHEDLAETLDRRAVEKVA